MINTVKRKQSQTLTSYQFTPNTIKQGGRGRRPIITDNHLKSYFIDNVDMDRLGKIDRRVEDVIVGICSLNWYGDAKKQRTLNYRSILKIYQQLSTVDTHCIMNLLEVGQRQAARYNKAFVLSYQWLSGYSDMMLYEPESDEWVDDEIDESLI